MGIVDDDIARVRAATDLVQLVAEHTEVKRSGRQWMARCPLHGERTPSLSINPEKGVYHCFGCQRSGDAITFVQELEGLDFVGAVERLAARAGITLRYTDADEGRTRSRRRRLLAAVAAAADFYHDRLLTGSDAGAARAYLRARGYDGEVVRRYRLGWAPDGWDVLARHLGLDDADLRDSGLGFVNRRGRQQDAFRGRIMFPITDDRGDVVGFGGRILPGAEGPKYKNTSSGSLVYDKSRVLFGLHEHRRQIVKAGEAIVCEGYTDVIGFATAGVERAVATCGTAMTEEHIRLLGRHSAKRLVLAFDADAAGRSAAARVYAWEREYGLEVHVADLPTGRDPGDLAREDPEALRRAVESAIPFLRFRVERVLESFDLRTVEGRARAAEAAVAVVAEHPDPLVRDPYVLEIADRCRLDERRLRDLADGPRPTSPVVVSDRSDRRTRPRAGVGSSGLGSPGDAAVASSWYDTAVPLDDHGPGEYPGRPGESRATQPTGPTSPTGPGGHPSPAEREALRLAIHRPDEADALAPELFADPVCRLVLEALQAGDDLLAVTDRLDPAAAGLVRRLAVEPTEVEPDDVLARLARLAADRELRDLSREASRAPAADRPAYADAIAWLKARVEELAESDTREAALDVLIPWLIEQVRGRDS